MKIRTPLVCLLSTLFCVVVLPASAVAQDIQEALRRAEQILGRPVSEREALRLLQQSGLTPEQVRERLAREGLPTDAADPYLAVLEGRAASVPEGTNPLPLFEALTGLDLTGRALTGDTTALREAARETGVLRPDTAAVEPEPGPPVFGREIFRRATTQFEPARGGPAPPDYRVGPGDELVVVLTGDVELAYRLTVAPEGWIVIPDVGRVAVSGRTLGELENGLRRRLSQVYSGLTGDESASTFLDVSLGTQRTNRIFVIGEVERPGAYDLSGFASGLTALYAAAGPTRTGSFRRILVNRGGATVATIDLYEYLLRGRAAQDLRLEHGDVVFVPPVARRVQVEGAVKRPGLYELQEGETLADLLEFAGGLAPGAEARRVQVERVLPPEERGEGPQRILVDVPLDGAQAERPLLDGDRVTVFAVLDEVRNEVRVSGGVWRPGIYAVGAGTRLWDVIERAGGLLPDVYEGRAQIQRLQADWTRRMLHASLDRNPDGTPVENPELESRDQVFVFARRSLREERAVSIGGWVRQPGVYPYVDGMSVRDLILRAGGLRTGAYLGAVDVARVIIAQSRSDTITRTFTVALDSSIVFDASRRAAGGTDRAAAVEPRGGDLVLQNLDAVYVRKAPGFEPQRRVVVTGEVRFPGPYSLQTRSERLTELLGRAGGLTSEAYPEGLQLWRSEPEAAAADTLSATEIARRALGDSLRVTPGAAQPGVPIDTLGAAQGAAAAEAARAAGRAQGQAPRDGRPQGAAPRPGQAVPGAEAAGVDSLGRPLIAAEPPPVRTRVGVDFLQALRDPENSPHNILIEPDDSIYVPSFIPTVDVRGAVQAPTKVLYREGADVGYYVNRAGGFAQDADKKRTRLQLANGEVRARGAKFLFFGGGFPEPDPGSAVIVPYKKPSEGGLDFTQLASVIASLATATATVIIAASR